MKTLQSAVLIFCLLFFPLANIAWADLPTPVARVVWVKGTLKAEMPNKEMRVLQKSSIVYLSDVLITDTGSQAQIVFTDNTLMTFRPDTKFIVDQYQFKPTKKKSSVGKYVMKLLQGGFRTITGLIAKQNPTDYEVDTPVATIGVRGTDYVVFLKNSANLKNPELYIGYRTGSPCVANLTDKKLLCLDVNTQNAVVSGPNVAPRALTTAEVPPELKEELQIVPATTNFGPSGGNANQVGPNGGTVTSFCIQ